MSLQYSDGVRERARAGMGVWGGKEMNRTADNDLSFHLLGTTGRRHLQPATGRSPRQSAAPHRPGDICFWVTER